MTLELDEEGEVPRLSTPKLLKKRRLYFEVDYETWQLAKKRAEERGFKSSDSSINRLYITWLVEADANHHLAYLDDGIKWMLAAIGEHLGSFAGGIIARYEKEFLEK